MKPNQAIQRLLTDWESPSYVMMVGVPGVGKSTFLEAFLKNLHEKVFIASTDNIIEEEAKRLGLTYSQVWEKINHKKIKREMEAGIVHAVQTKSTIFHDQTNMGRKARVSKLAPIPDSYKKICLNFSVDDKILQQRLDARAAATGKVIPPFIIKNMFSTYVPPSKAEGWNLIVEIDNT